MARDLNAGAVGVRGGARRSKGTRGIAEPAESVSPRVGERPGWVSPQVAPGALEPPGLEGDRAGGPATWARSVVHLEGQGGTSFIFQRLFLVPLCAGGRSDEA